MKKLLTLLATGLVLFSASCNKDDNKDNSGGGGTTGSPYYFKFKKDGTQYNLNANFPQYMFFNTNEAGGYQVKDAAMYPSMALSFQWTSKDTVLHDDVMGLAGKTFYFDDVDPMPELSFEEDINSEPWVATDMDHANKIVVSEVKYEKVDTTFGYIVDVYKIKGTCNAKLGDGTSEASFTNGEFNFLISRRKY